MLPRFIKKKISSLSYYYEKDSWRDRNDGNLARAVGTMQLAAFLEPTRERFLWIAEMLDALGDLPGAEKAIEKSVQLYGSEPTFEVLFIKGITKSRLGKDKEAIRAMQKALKVKPDHPGGIYALGSLYASTGDFASANVLFSKDAQIETGNGSPTYTRALRFPEESAAKSPINPEIVADHFESMFREYFEDIHRMPPPVAVAHLFDEKGRLKPAPAPVTVPVKSDRTQFKTPA